jgi:hypothetical protein
MSRDFLVATNENGMILDQYIDSDLEDAMDDPFQFGQVFLYSHGWWTNATRAMEGYNRFNIEFARFLGMIPTLTELPILSIGLHWPSTLTEADVSLANYFQALSFYTMEKRANAIGENSAYTLLRLLLSSWKRQTPRLHVHLVGHSFGAKVVCSALERLVESSQATPIPDGVSFDLVLLQAAFDNDEFATPNEYGRLAKELPGLRLLVTRSSEDNVLGKLYPAAHDLARLFGKDKPALGYTGPSDEVKTLFGGAKQIAVGPRFQPPADGFSGRLVVADLTPLHRAHPDLGEKFSGHHSDIFHDEIYALMCSFFGFNAQYRP